MELENKNIAISQEKPEDKYKEIQEEKEEKMAEYSPSLETLWNEYSDPETKTIPQTNMKILLEKYWTAQGLSAEKIKEFSDKKISIQENFDFQTIKEILEEVPLSFPPTFPMIKINLEEQTYCSAPAILHRFSEEVIKKKLQKHSNNIQNILNLEPKEEISKLLQNIFTQCQFGIIHKSMANQKEAAINLNSLIKFYSNFYRESNTELSISTLEDLLIIFLKQNKDYMGIDITNELNLYAGESLPEKLESSEACLLASISDPMGNLKTSSQENPASELAMNLQNTITMYENLYAQQKSQNKEASYTSRLLKMLRSQMQEIQTSQGNENKSLTLISNRKTSQVTLYENNIKVLKEIFHAYNKQRTLAHPRKTFDEVANEICTMNMGYFFKFLKDFEIDIELKRVKELYVRIAIAGRELHFEQFIELIQSVAMEIAKKKGDISSISKESCFLELLLLFFIIIILIIIYSSYYYLLLLLFIIIIYLLLLLFIYYYYYLLLLFYYYFIILFYILLLIISIYIVYFYYIINLLLLYYIISYHIYYIQNILNIIKKL